MKNIKGQSLFEVVIALAVVSLVAVAIVGLATVSVKNSTYSDDKTSANFYAQESIEWLRQFRDENTWADFYVNGDVAPDGKTWCLPKVTEVVWDDNASEGTCNADDIIDGTNFTREKT
ncbi:prepilin-type N-terminal cleavage/methylation domain-containing protein [Patescibacteria group bacterium]